MDIAIHGTFFPYDAPAAFYRDTLGFEVRSDVGHGGMRSITVGPAEQPGTSISASSSPLSSARHTGST